MSVDAIKQQLFAEKAIFKYTYGGDELDAWITDVIANALARFGTSDIRNIRFYRGPGDASLAENVYAGFTGAGEKLGYKGFDIYGNKIDPSQIVVANVVPDITFYYDVVTGKRFEGYDFGTQYNAAGTFLGLDLARFPADFFMRTESADYEITITINYIKSGLPYFYAKLKRKVKDQSIFADIVGFLAPIAPLVGLGLNFAIPGLGSAIGNAVLGAVGVTSAGLGAAIGQVAISTALNGGDIERAVISQLTSTVGGFAGDFAGGALDSQIIGQATAAATSAAVAGGDIKEAVFSSLLQQGAYNMSSGFDYLFDVGSSLFGSSYDPAIDGNIDIAPEEIYGNPADFGPQMPDLSMVNPADYGPQMPDFSGVNPYALDFDSYDFQDAGSPAFPETVYQNFLNDPNNWNLGLNFADPIAGSGGLVPDSFGTDTYDPYDFQDANSPNFPYVFGSGTGLEDLNIPVYTGTPPVVVANQPPSTPSKTTTPGSEFDFGSVIGGVTAAALAALRVVQAYKAAGQPQVVKAGTVTSTGSVVTANTNGTITQRNTTTGQTSTSLPPAGVPYQAADGSIITNNGNGTYTRVSPTGQSTTAAYSQTASGVYTGGSTGVSGFFDNPNNKPIIYGGAALLAIFLLKGK